RESFDGGVREHGVCALHGSDAQLCHGSPPFREFVASGLTFTLNASLQLLPEAGARHERTLEAVSCKARLCEKSIFRQCGRTKSMVCKARTLQKRGFDTV